MALWTALAGFQLRRVKRTLLLLASLAVLSDAASAHTLRGKKVRLMPVTPILHLRKPIPSQQLGAVKTCRAVPGLSSAIDSYSWF